jgi:hypothetical protein
MFRLRLRDDERSGFIDIIDPLLGYPSFGKAVRAASLRCTAPLADRPGLLSGRSLSCSSPMGLAAASHDGSN